MQRKFLGISNYRSLADPRLIIDEKQAVVVIRANKKAPYQATLLLEVCNDKPLLLEVCNNQSFTATLSTTEKLRYDVFNITYFSRAEYGDPTDFGYSSTTYGSINVEQRHHSLYIDDKSCFIKAIPREKAHMIYVLAQEHEKEYSHDPNMYLNISSLDFCRSLLMNAKVLSETDEFILTDIPKKNYSKTTLLLWDRHRRGRCNPAIDSKSESDFAANLLSLAPLKLDPQLQLTPKARLQHFFKAHYEKTHVIDWESKEGQDIQFLQDRLGLMVFSYKNILPYYLEKSIPMPTVLFGLIVEYALLVDKPAYFSPDLEPQNTQNRCLMM